MSDQAYSPGPWGYEDPGQHCGHPCTANGCHEGYPSGTWWIDGPSWADGGSPTVDNEADARLIAAAPAMYEAIARALEHYADGLPQHLVEEFREAIAGVAA